MDKLYNMIYKNAVSKINSNDYANQSAKIEATYKKKEMAFNDQGIHENEVEAMVALNNQVSKMRSQCDMLASIIICNIQREVEDAIDELKKAKKELNGQQVKQGGEDKIEALMGKIDFAIERLKDLNSTNDEFIKKNKKFRKE